MSASRREQAQSDADLGRPTREGVQARAGAPAGSVRRRRPARGGRAGDEVRDRGRSDGDEAGNGDDDHERDDQGGGKDEDGKDAKGKDDGKKDKGDKDGDDKDGDDKDGGDKKGGDKKGSDKKEGGKDKEDGPKRRWPIVLLVVVIILAIAGGTLYWYLTRNQEDTDDAYTEGNPVSIAPKVSGYVIERLVDDNSFVHPGDLMLRIDPRDYVTARDQARANLDLARAQLRSAQIDLEISRVRYPADRVQAQAQLGQAMANQADARREYRRQHTVDQRATTQTTVDQATTQYESTTATVQQMQAQLQVASLVPQNIATVSSTLKQRQAQVAQAEASLAQAELNLSYTEVRAPAEGKITRRNVEVGTFAQPGQQVFYLVPVQTWVVANFKETQLNRMRVGQHVTIQVDAYPKLKLHGHVESIQQGAGARFTTFPSENATGNFVKIVRRVPVKITIDDGLDPNQGLPLGLSVEPTVDLK